jgi:hypothetical protein
MEINSYLKSNFEQLPLSHLNFIPAASPVSSNEKGKRISGKRNNKKYELLYLDFYNFYKPISNYFR